MIEFKGSEASKLKCYKYLDNLASNFVIQPYEIYNKAFTDSILKFYQLQIEQKCDVMCFTSQKNIPTFLIAVNEKSRYLAEGKIKLANDLINAEFKNA